jgi:hypothetical protein
MKKFLLVLTLFFTVGIAQTFAQDAAAKPKKENFSWNKKYMTEAGFDAALQAKIEDSKKANDAEVKAVNTDKSLSEEDKKTQRAALSLKRQKVINDMLSDAQKAKIAEVKAGINKRNAAIKE